MPRGTSRLAAPTLTLLTAAACGGPYFPDFQPPPTRPVRRWEGDTRIPDVSYAGYHMGADAPPRVRVAVEAVTFGAKGDGVTNDTAALQAALDAAQDGAVVLRPGRFVIRDALRFRFGHVVLRGAGQFQTTLVVPDALDAIHPDGDRQHGRLHGFLEARGTDEGAKIADVTATAVRGDHAVCVGAPKDPSRPLPKAGDMVRVRMGNSVDLGRHLLGGTRSPGSHTAEVYPHYVDFASPVTRVEGGTPGSAVCPTKVILERPLRTDVRPEWGAELMASRPTLEEIGVEDLAFEFAGPSETPHPEDEGFNGIYFRNVVHGWVRNVHIQDADAAIQFEGCRFCQVQGALLGLRPATAKRHAALRGHHGLRATGAQDCVFAHVVIDTTFDHDVTVEGFASGNVFMEMRAQALSLDHHRDVPYENVFTDIDAGEGRRLWASGGDPDRGPHAGVREVLWNMVFTGQPPPLPGAMQYDQPDGGWPLLTLVGVMGYPAAKAADAANATGVVVEPALVTPPNLYVAQRQARRSAPRQSGPPK